jgi:hypothetical protein
MHLPINVKSPNNISKWQMRFNSAFKGLNKDEYCKLDCVQEKKKQGIYIERSTVCCSYEVSFVVPAAVLE